MKLSKEDLKRLVWHSQGGLNDCDSLAWLELIDGILNGRYDEPLEIEGYIREDHFADASKMGWTKFDPDKEDTYPPKGEFIAWGLPDPDCYGAHVEFFCWRDDGGFSCNESAYPEVLYWQPSPKPPVEKERSKNESM